MKKYYHKVKKHLTHHAHKAIKQKASPHSIAIGFAIGTFVAIFPTFFFGLVIILLIMLFYKTMNKIAAVAGLAFWNFIMMVPIYWLSYNIGRLIFGGDRQSTIRSESQDLMQLLKEPFSFQNLMDFLRENILFIKEYFLGNLIVAVFFSVLSYFLMKNAVIAYRHAREKRSLRNPKKTKSKS